MSFFEEYERCNFWSPGVRRGVARLLASTRPSTALFIGCGTGTNDAFPFAEAAPGCEVLATDVDPRMVRLMRLKRRANVRPEELDLLAAGGTYDLVAAFFVIHRLGAWREGARRLAGLVAPGGSLFVSEFAGPGGLIAMANEPRWRRGEVGRMMDRYFERHPFEPELRSTRIGPVRALLGRALRYWGRRDFVWRTTLTLGEVFRRMQARSYAPFFGTKDRLEDLAEEFGGSFGRRVAFREVIRIFRYERPKRGGSRRRGP